ncbi:MAG: dihydrolipoyl dehydrogenase [Zetaproteobacteria bacterium]|nr:dihydrolipoyl dehydrogenase [Zetaproteobacteria bacterium]
MMAESYDVVVVGAGPGGYVCAIRCAQLGLKVVCVESRATLGGTCLNVGCIPSKAMLESSHHYHRAVSGELDTHGVAVSGVQLDLAKLLQRKRQVVEKITGGVEFLFKKNKVHRVLGHGCLRPGGEVDVLDENQQLVQQLQAKHVVLAMGSVPVDIPVAKMDHQYILDSTDILELTEVPERLVVVGGGVIGLELGSVWARLGAQVTVLEAQPNILPTMDGAIQKEMMKILKKQGLQILTGSTLQSSQVNQQQGFVTLAYTDKKGDQVLEADKVLVAVGRRACTQNCGLEESGVQLTSRGLIQVDERFRTSKSNVYAIGDLIAGPMLAHKAEEEGVALAEMLVGQSGHVPYDYIPSVVYTWPEVASVGKTEEELKQSGVSYKVGKFLFRANGRAQAAGEPDGFVKFLADKKTDKLLGAHIVGASASELVAEIATAFEYGASAEDIARTIHAHPTLAEVLKEAALDVDDRAIHA